MTSRGDRAAVARYIELLSLKGDGTKAAHTEIAARINEMNPGAKVAGTLVSRWRSRLLDVSPGNLAAFARAYDRSPLEAFVVAGLLELQEAEAGLDKKSKPILDIVWSDVAIEVHLSPVESRPLPDPSDPAAVADFLREQKVPSLADKRRAARTYAKPVDEAARPKRQKSRSEDE